MNFFPIHFEWIKTDLMSVWKAGDKGTRQLYELHHKQKDAEYGVHLSDAGLPEGEVGCQILCWNCQDLQTRLAVKRR